MIEIVTRDETTLPNELLGPAKSFLRVDHCEDDADIALMIASAIELFQSNMGITLYPTEYLWTVEESFCNGVLDVTPEQLITPIGEWSAWAPDATTEVTSQYSLRRRGLHRSAFYSLKGAAQTGLSLKIASGYTAATLPAGIRSSIFQLTSKFNEYRDVLKPANLEIPAEWFNTELAGFWVPRA